MKVTVKNAVARLKVTPAIARELVDIVNGPNGIENSDYQKMERLNTELKGCGVEAVRVGDDLLSYIKVGNRKVTICHFQGEFNIVPVPCVVEKFDGILV
jgi:hypothetical protein